MEPITITVIATTALVGWIIKKTTDVKKENTKREKLKAKTEIELSKIRAAQEDNKKAQKEKEDWEKKYQDQEKENKKIKNELEQAKNKANDSSLSQEERGKWRRKVSELESELNKGEKKSQTFFDKIRETDDRIKKNNNTIASINSSSLNEGYQLEDFLNLETVMILISFYIVYQFLLKDDRR